MEEVDVGVDSPPKQNKKKKHWNWSWKIIYGKTVSRFKNYGVQFKKWLRTCSAKNVTTY